MATSLLRQVFPRATVLRIAGWGLAIVVAALVVWMSPMSPAALGQADVAVGMRQPEVAAWRYDQVAALNPFPWVRDEALYRGAIVWATDLGNPAEARRRLEQLVAARPTLPNLAEVEERIGQLELDGEHRPAAAAEAFLAAWATAQADPRAADRLIAAARAFAEAGDVDRAIHVWGQVGERFPDRRGEALVARAATRLAADDVEGALGDYRDAVKAGDPHARLGVATCLERLGELDEALAGLDGVDLPADVKAARREAIRSRRADAVDVR